MSQPSLMPIRAGMGNWVWSIPVETTPVRFLIVGWGGLGGGVEELELLFKKVLLYQFLGISPGSWRRPYLPTILKL